MPSIRDDEVIRQKYIDMYSTDIEVVRKHIEGSKRYKNLIVPEVIVDVNIHFNDKKFVQYIHSLPSDQNTMVLRYQNILQNDKDIQKLLSKKKQNHHKHEHFELINWLSMNYRGYNYIFHPVEEEEFDESLCG